MAKRLFVGGTPYSATDKDLEEFFSKVGKVVSAKVIVDKFTGQGKGFGFVEMDTDEEAMKAVKELNNTNFGGRTIVVNEARPMEPRDNTRFDRNRGSHDRDRGYPRQGRSRRW